MTDQEKIEQLLSMQQYMVLAITLDDGTPWAVPVKIQAHDGYRSFEWDSRLDTMHSRAIAARPEMAITVYQKFDDSQVGLYLKGNGVCIEERGEYGRYRCTATQAWLNDETFMKRQVEIG